MIELTTTALFLLSVFYGSPDTALTAEAKIQTAAVYPETMETFIRDYFKDTPILGEIARCESQFRHVGQDGKILRGELSRDDIGVMQINTFYHESRAKKLGFDLHTLDGNLAYARWLHAKEGLTPWMASSKCWEKSQIIAKSDRHASLD